MTIDSWLDVVLIVFTTRSSTLDILSLTILLTLCLKSVWSITFWLSTFTLSMPGDTTIHIVKQKANIKKTTSEIEKRALFHN
jgi:hypothetical protein